METITAKVNNEAKKLAKIKINNTPENGFQIYLQSDHNFQIFASPSEKTFNLGGVRCSMPRNGDGSTLNGVQGYFSTVSDRFVLENLFNLSLLLARDLKSGVTFNFGVIPIGEEKIVEYLSSFRNQVKQVYLSYMKAINITMLITTETVEREYFD